MTKSKLRKRVSFGLWFQRDMLYHGMARGRCSISFFIYTQETGRGCSSTHRKQEEGVHPHTGNRKRVKVTSRPPVMCYTVARLHLPPSLITFLNRATNQVFKYLSLWAIFLHPTHDRLPSFPNTCQKTRHFFVSQSQKEIFF